MLQDTVVSQKSQKSNHLDSPTKCYQPQDNKIFLSFNQMSKLLSLLVSEEKDTGKAAKVYIPLQCNMNTAPAAFF